MIRHLRVNEKDNIFELGTKIFRKEDEIPLLQKALTLCVPELSFVAVENKTIIGFTLVCKTMTNVYFNFMTTIPHFYELAFLGISPQCQGRGLGSRLMKESLHAIFYQMKQFTCWLLVDTTNTLAIKMYEKYGFRKWINTTDATSATSAPGWIMGLSYRRYMKLLQNNIHDPVLLKEVPIIG
jgi:GNAT superfamily N-acetyltransferase